ncbi:MULTISPECIES: DUF397 domain-containing protein [unclassified Solwaraspora]|uniref:DUF397 domain-containing protein n=1 Tax=unclassified Solwaraspora TaxID=2627926 RepID=UPI00248C3105|nr:MULTISPECIES: DUF397 domain-containing protein [unclassified Solwaraspora]WBB95147.1 DUF397 domain-containing protein [Solwaraspora sp. WMMA2059]WBC20969.1 DUF397 domain-containing protein [Solwaraspora sp. WMMA2080]WJK36941.1 DUF397 domain-containing protein [Solwaraspora sp. WMMA2065]
MPTPDLTTARWFTSSRSANNGDCVECAVLPDAVAVRDSKDRTGPTLHFSADQWITFVTQLTARQVS